jgi:hypothetical protein
MKIKTLLLSMCLLLSATAFGQNPPKMDAFFFHAADVNILQDKRVQTELKISEAQRNRMNQMADRHKQKVDALAKQYEKEKKNMQQFQADPKLVGYFLELKQNVLAQLDATQLKRLAEFSLQNVGLAALCDEKVAERVGMSKDQLAKMRKAYQDGGTRFAGIERKAAEPVMGKYKDRQAKDAKEAEALQKQFDAELAAAMKKAQPDLQKAQREIETAMRAILTKQQLDKYQALLGKPWAPK